ncbi:TetR/AcrR family transcriptional regulator [Clostridium sp. 'deep sea']|uniref:TetR/AcrR family transcriptional regulator n=1 Tax=Clostridium sp. 'deep sea' TaxID=2779445 RepID=UPI0018966E2C|nr:TetR/AcrR family transcriptional regulator [Clostridium sp. 'deep sea']QOR36693.1 TetR/AcrR family transcriptional regulator [Clostridium sp. 'deep sea']
MNNKSLIEVVGGSSMARAFTEIEKAEIKQKIITVASDLFKQKPYKEVKISAITKKLGIAKGSFYNFFSSKEELLITIFSELEKQFHNQIIVTMSNSTNKKQFLIEIMSKLTLECRHNELFKAILQGDVIQDVLQNIPKGLKQQLLKADQQLLEQLIEQDLILKVTPQLAIDMLRSLFYLQTTATELNSNIDIFNMHMIRAVVNEIFE